MLATIMNKQRELQERLGYDFGKMTDAERAEFMRNHRGYLEDEVAEALYEMPGYKTWKDYSCMSDEAKEIAWAKVRMELIDALHFFTNLLLGAGFTADEVFKMYMMKNAENHRRQDEGYTADVSYRDQSVEDVMHKAYCTVTMDDEVNYSSDFIAILHKKDGDASIFYNTDALSLGMAVKILARHYIEALNKCTEEERYEIEHILGDAFVANEEVAAGE
jgi:dimeric dUTPase (all-alpha-NTP-PPase superfamily)